MVASEVAITVSIELLARRAHLSLATILVDRSLLALALLVLILRPAPAQWMPRSPRLALLRVVTGGLTFVGWFGAIGLLSGRVTQSVLLLDALILAYVRGARRAYERRTLLVLAAALILFAAEAVREPGTVLERAARHCVSTHRPGLARRHLQGLGARPGQGRTSVLAHRSGSRSAPRWAEFFSASAPTPRCNRSLRSCGAQCCWSPASGSPDIST